MKPITVYAISPSGDRYEIAVPGLREVCSNCNGEGSHVNRAIDGHGLTREDFEEDPEFEEAYFRGDFDVACEECGGNKVVDYPNLDLVDEQTREDIFRERQEEAQSRAENDAERRMGA